MIQKERSVLGLTILFAIVLLIPPVTSAQENATEVQQTWRLSLPESPLGETLDLLHTTWFALRARDQAPGHPLPPRKPTTRSKTQTETGQPIPDPQKSAESPFQDRIQLHRYRALQTAKATLFFLPGTWMNGESTEPDERYNLWLYLARRGVEVFTLDYRTHALLPEAEDLSFLRHWAVETFVEDVRTAGQWVQQQNEGRPIFVAGFSRGVFYAYAYAASRPEGLVGLVALDGFFKHHTPQGGIDLEADLRQLEENGQWAMALGSSGGRSRGWKARQQLMATAASDPSAAPLERDPPGSFSNVGEQLASTLFHAWGPGALANPIEGPGKGKSSVQALARLLHGYDRFFPRIQDLQGRAFGDSLDDPRTVIDDGWRELEIPVIFFGSTGMGNDFLLHGISSASQASGNRAEIHVLEGHGHLDILVGEHSKDQVYEPILRWIGRTLAQHEPKGVPQERNIGSPKTDSGGRK
ncbi:MAG: alpha/beta hydrolase [Deltaproteobacteria bacterium]|nr:alpha/beta hydrolase [Deltaproteobacteria bacterium]